MAIPHALVLAVVGSIDALVTVFSWIAIVFTGRLPVGLANFNCMVIRYNVRVSTFTLFLRNSYPPFDFDATAMDNGTDPEVVVSFGPELEGRRRASVFFRIILLIPVAIMNALWAFLLGIVGIIGFFVVLLMGRWPVGMRDFMIGVHRFQVRTGAYANLLTDRYPPLGLN